jgi:flagellin
MRISDFSHATLKAAEAARKATAEINVAQKRISTGLRVNSAADDPGSIGAVSRLTGEIQKFVQNSTSNLFSQKMLEAADLAHQNVVTMLDSMLSSANNSLSASATKSSRESNQKVVSGLKTSVDSAARKTSFNGKNLTDGSFANQRIGGGTGNSAVQFSIASIETGKIGTHTVTLAAKAADDAASATANGAFNVVGTSTAGVDYTGGDSAETIAGLINAVTDQTGVTAMAETKAKLRSLSDAGTVSFTLNGVASGNVTVTSTSDLSPITTAINAMSATTGIYAETSADKTYISLSSSTGKNIVFTLFDNDNAGADSIVLAALNRAGTEINTETISNTNGGASAKMAVRGYVVMNSDRAFSYAMTQASGTDFSSANSSFRGLSDIDISTEVGAAEAKETIASAREMISNARTEIGGVINRLKFAEDYNQGQRIALTSARGNMVDADIAQESANLARSSIILETSMAIMAQANVRKELLLNLLNSSWGSRGF